MTTLNDNLPQEIAPGSGSTQLDLKADSNFIDWAPGSWRNKPVRHLPTYDDEIHLSDVLNRLSSSHPLVEAYEVEKLREHIADAIEKRRFILQGGDCAERFMDCNQPTIEQKLKTLLQVAWILKSGVNTPVDCIGRIAGQFAKPRSHEIENINGTELPVFRGENVNDFEPEPLLRRPDPDRLIGGYQISSKTLQYLRKIMQGNLDSLFTHNAWDLSRFTAAADSEDSDALLKQMVAKISVINASLNGELKDVSNVYISHEGLLLPYEEALTRYVPEHNSFYNLSAHMLWIGDRTKNLEEAHVEYFRGIRNPIGIKWGPNSSIDEMLRIIQVLNPNNEAGRIVLITRFGRNLVSKKLPRAVKAVQKAGMKVLWSCDPMHGNTHRTTNKFKTRRFLDIFDELRDSYLILKSEGMHLGGVHFEMTGDHVTECIGGIEGITEENLSINYETLCDPRLNYSQSLEMALRLAEFMTT